MRVTLDFDFSKEGYERLEFLAEEAGETVEEFLEDLMMENLIDLLDNNENDDSDIEDGVYADDDDDIES
jgi:hypothetical protein